MAAITSKHRWAENEAVFRKANQKIQTELRDLETMLGSEGNSSLMGDTEAPIYFVCECADENCFERIRLKSHDYDKLHRNPNQFVIRPGHMVAAIEKKVHSTKTYEVVQKFIKPPKNITGLNPTPINNV